MLDSSRIPKYKSELTIPPVFQPCCEFNSDRSKCILTYDVDMVEIETQMLPEDFPTTRGYAYGGIVYDEESCCGRYAASIPGPTFEANTDEEVLVRWHNKLDKPHILPVDPTLHWANPNNMEMPNEPFKCYPPGYSLAQYPIPTVVHLHGGETPGRYDGFPDAWFTHDGKLGEAYESNEYLYLNKQQSSTLFYHDHALGITRLNVYAGLSGFYILKDPNNDLDNCAYSVLPSGPYEIPLMIQDKTFNKDGSLYFSAKGDSASHPYWRRFFYGNTNVVNGKVWPNLDVEKTAYRFQIVNAANARFYKFKLSNGQKIIQIGSDGGYLEHPVWLDELLLAPAERADIIIDFSQMQMHEEVVLLNVTEDDQTDPDTTGQVMRFRVKYNSCQPPLCLPDKLNHIPKLTETVPKRVVVLNAVNKDGKVDMLMLNGQTWIAPVSEKPLIGSTQIWEIVNIATGPHPIHIHLVDSQVVNRQEIDRDRYAAQWLEINGPPPFDHPTQVVDPEDYLIGDPIQPLANETGWKDTVVCPPGQVTRLILPLFPSILNPECVKVGVNYFPFDPTEFPGYVWHCHMLDHEDNEMMRPMQVVED